MRFAEAMELVQGGAHARRAGWEDETAMVHKATGADSGVVMSSATGYGPYSPTEEDSGADDWATLGVQDAEERGTEGQPGSGVAGPTGDPADSGG